MNALSRLVLVTSAALALNLSTNTALAQNQPNQQNRGNRQNRGNFDPAQMQQRMLDRYREQLEVKSDDEWKVIEPRIQKVMDARREAGNFGRGAFGGRAGRGGNANSDNASNDQGTQNRGRRGGGRQLSPAAQDLQQALEAKASAEEIKSKLAKYREEHQQKQAALQKAQDDLKGILNVRQEATAVMLGLLN